MKDNLEEARKTADTVLRWPGKEVEFGGKVHTISPIIVLEGTEAGFFVDLESPIEKL